MGGRFNYMKLHEMVNVFSSGGGVRTLHCKSDMMQSDMGAVGA